MAYPKLKTDKGEIEITPELICSLGDQFPPQIKNMTGAEIVSLCRALKETGLKTGLARIWDTIKGIGG